ncbi:MAG TPA: hypothetical protein ENH88_17130 [Pseudoalteromonas prydzensis]|uniref:Uncharacterized protein n=1 Tax=Pseudoalteromonas prydzensis TaxID=182141 RepID=A0A7V1GFY2_9GAMM|nr:hypothetical protein [Pseudoalteromonas prydzensis]HEA18129.1 hypothetical protein [Pseudoalteromonas prydzensis]
MNKKLISSVIMAVIGCAAGNLQAKTPAELAAIQREVGIMENILSSALKQDTDKKIRAISANYFVDQGVVFELDVRGASRWQTIFSHAPNAPLPPLPDIDFSNVNVEFISDHVEVLSEQAVESSREAYQQAMEVMREGAERVRDIAEQERDVSRDLRDLEREKRDLEFASRHDNSVEAKELEQRKKTLEKEIAKLEKQQTTLTKQQQQLRQDINAKQAEREKQQAAEQQKLLTQVNHSISLTLCDYGSGLRSLPNDEHVSFVLKGLADKNKSLIKVFNKADIKKCVVGDIKAGDLALKAISYQF